MPTWQLQAILDRAVQRAVFAQDPRTVGINVSGGLDSSTVCRLARRWVPNLTAFTGWYDEPGFDEREYARMAAGVTHHFTVKITPKDFTENFDEMMRHFTPPFQGPGMFGQYMVAKYISSNWPAVKVVLSGEGADELFGGYARLMKVAGEKLPDGYDHHYQPPADYPKTVKEALQYDLDRLPDLLKVDDEALGAFGLKAVAPFTDPKVVEYALQLPDSQRINKRHLRTVVQGLVPDPIIQRTDKKGFPVPFVKWANEPGNPVRDFVGDRLGYIPAMTRPYDRTWWTALCDRTHEKLNPAGVNIPPITTTTSSVSDVSWKLVA